MGLKLCFCPFRDTRLMEDQPQQPHSCPEAFRQHAQLAGSSQHPSNPGSDRLPLAWGHLSKYGQCPLTAAGDAFALPAPQSRAPFQSSTALAVQIKVQGTVAREPACQQGWPSWWDEDNK